MRRVTDVAVWHLPAVVVPAAMAISIASCSANGPHPAPSTSSITATPLPTLPTAAPPYSTSPPGHAAPVLPDPSVTPGALNPEVSQATIGQTICVSGWTATVRPPETYTEQVKRLEARGGGTVTYQDAVYQVHGFALTDPDISHFELDHLIPLELGGAPADPRNLWMEPFESPKGPAVEATGAQTKDTVESNARRAVCAGRISLIDAQRGMATNWAALQEKLVATNVAPTGG